ncbi:hypothetical protein DL767_002143 [Monosporascus sp. MG133]|nr:hypothetical protein DL767_002143 [Monosporascus sp. MG133]
MVDKTLLFEAAKTGTKDDVIRLLGSKPTKRDVDAKDEHQRTAFFFAVSCQKWETAKALLSPPYNADPKAMCHCCNTTALAKAAEFGCLELVKLLVDKHAPVNQKNNVTNETPETLARRYGHDDCVTALKRHKEQTIETLKKNALRFITKFVDDSDGLSAFYGGENKEEQKTFLEPKAETAAKAVHDLLKGGGDSSEAVKRLCVLALYDLVVLIDDSDSMIFEEEGKRIDALAKTVKAIVKTYSSLHSSTDGEGVRAIRFLNGKKKMDHVVPEHLASTVNPHPIKRHRFEGGTKLGTALKKKVLEVFVPGIDNEQDGPLLYNPLLIVVITDGEVDSDNKSVLEKVVKKYAEKVERKYGRHSLAFQFARIGDDEDAKTFLEELDESETCGKYVSVDAVGLGLSDLLKTKSKKRRELVVHVLCGALYKSDGTGEDKDDYEDEDRNSVKSENDDNDKDDGADDDDGDDD